jgi:hypothetical protein
MLHFEIERAEEDASQVWNRIISCHRRMSDTFDEHERVLLVGKCRELKTLQEKVLAARRRIKTVPTARDLEEILGYNEDTVRYGLKVFHDVLGGAKLTRAFDRTDTYYRKHAVRVSEYPTQPAQVDHGTYVLPFR